MDPLYTFSIHVRYTRSGQQKVTAIIAFRSKIYPHPTETFFEKQNVTFWERRYDVWKCNDALKIDPNSKDESVVIARIIKDDSKSTQLHHSYEIIVAILEREFQNLGAEKSDLLS